MDRRGGGLDFPGHDDDDDGTVKFQESTWSLSLKAVGLALSLATLVYFAGRTVSQLDTLADHVRSIQVQLESFQHEMRILSTQLTEGRIENKTRIDSLDKRVDKLEDRTSGPTLTHGG